MHVQTSMSVLAILERKCTLAASRAAPLVIHAEYAPRALLKLSVIVQFQYYQAFLKKFEKIVHSRLTKYLTKHLNLSNNQFGFRSNHDISMAVIDMVHKITAAIDAGHYSVGIFFMDLSKTLTH